MEVKSVHCLRPIHDDSVFMQKIVVPTACITEAIS